MLTVSGNVFVLQDDRHQREEDRQTYDFFFSNNVGKKRLNDYLFLEFDRRIIYMLVPFLKIPFATCAYFIKPLKPIVRAADTFRFIIQQISRSNVNVFGRTGEKMQKNVLKK